MNKLILRLAVLLLLPLGPVQAQPRGDVAGGRDHPLVGRYEGAVLRHHHMREFDEFRMIDRQVLNRDRQQTGTLINDRNSRPVAGRALRLRYEAPAGRSAAEVLRNHQQALAAKGFETVFACRAQACGDPVAFWNAVVESAPGPGPRLTSAWRDQSYLLARLERPEGEVLVAMLAVENREGPQLLVDVVEARPMQADRITFVDATAMQRAVEETGRVALYGINFGFDSAEILPDSRPTLEEVARFLRANAALRVVVAGHTDSQGEFDYNLGLSARRAQAVVAALTRDFGIPAARLTAFGAGMAAPLARNDDEAGRARNRRVEIVRR
jgi:OOP family OmpA-OmpF porin